MTSVPQPAAAAAGGVARDAAAGLLLATVGFAYALSSGALIFSGRLAPFAGAGVAASALSAAVATLILARLSSFPRALGGPDTPVIAVLAALAAGAAAGTPGVGPSAQALANVSAALLLAAAATAALLLLAGTLRLASFVRFIPFPVIAGFLGASGWFLSAGAVSIAARAPAEAALSDLLARGPTAPLLAAVAFAAAVQAARRLTGSSLAAPVLVLGAGAAVAAAAQSGLVAPAALRAAGWLAPEVAEGGPPLPALSLLATPPDWALLLHLSPEILSVAGIAAVAILLNASALEAQARADIDPNREFLASGAANLVISGFGGLASNLSLNRSSLNVELGARSRGAALVCGVALLGLAAAGSSAGAIVPVPALAGLLLSMGVSLMGRWLIAAPRRFTWGEHLLALGIFAMIVRFGYLEGVAVGIVAACVSFAVACARAPAVRQAMSRRDYASFVDRPREDEALLRAEGDRLRVFRLQGFLFFGVAHGIAEQVRAAAEAGRAAGRPLSAVVLDFRGVTGSDSTARVAFARLAERLEEDGTRLVFTGLAAEDPRSRALGEALAGREVFPTLEQGLEACERRLLAAFGRGEGARADALGWLTEATGDPAAAAALVGRMERRDLAPGEALCRQGGPSDEMYFVVCGRVSIFLDLDGAPPLRLRSALGRTVIGEIGFFTGATRSASVIADEPTEVWALSAAALRALKSETPAAALAAEELVIRVLADRLTFANREIAALK